MEQLIDLVKSFQTTFLRWLFFLLEFLTVNLTFLPFYNYFFLLTLIFVLQWHSLHWEVLMYWLFIKIKRRCYFILPNLWMFCWKLERPLWSLKQWSIGEQLASIANNDDDDDDDDDEEQTLWVDPCWKWCIHLVFQILAATAKKHSFCLYLRNISSGSTVKIKQTCNHWKRVLESAKLVFASKKIKFDHFLETWISCFLKNS